MTDSNTTETKTRKSSPRTRAVVLSNSFSKAQASCENFQARADKFKAEMDAILAEVKANPEVKAIFDKLVTLKADETSDEAPAESSPVAVAAE